MGNLFCKLWVFVWVITSKWASFQCGCEAENVHISHKITLDTVSASSFFGSGTAPESVAWWQSSVLALFFCLGGDLLIFANYISLHVNSILVITECYVKQSIHTLPDKENILGLTILWLPISWSEKDTVYLQACWWGADVIVFDSHGLPGYCRVINSQSQPDVHLPH